MGPYSGEPELGGTGLGSQLALSSGRPAPLSHPFLVHPLVPLKKQPCFREHTHTTACQLHTGTCLYPRQQGTGAEENSKPHPGGILAFLPQLPPGLSSFRRSCGKEQACQLRDRHGPGTSQSCRGACVGKASFPGSFWSGSSSGPLHTPTSWPGHAGSSLLPRNPAGCPSVGHSQSWLSPWACLYPASFQQ